MQKIGYAVLASIYLISFSIGRGIVDSVDASSMKAKASNQTIVKSLANDLSDAIGMNDFFDSLSVGL